MNLHIFLKKALFKLRGGVLTLYPQGSARGRALLSHEMVGFFRPDDDPLSAHPNYWGAKQIAQTFLDKGYVVDVIRHNNAMFVPKKPYDFVVDVDINLGRLGPLLNKECIKIFHAAAAHWLFQNTAEYQRCLDLQRRRAVTVYPRRTVKPSLSAEHADIIAYYGNEFTRGTYEYLNKEFFFIPAPLTHTYPSPKNKDFDSARKNFIWFGGAGAVHKGLDLTLEAFASLPDYHLTICGKVGDKDFLDAYKKELALPNISFRGWIDAGGPEFENIRNESIGLVFPSCSEGAGQSGLVATNAGLLPIVSFETGISVKDFGVLLKENTIPAIREAVTFVSKLPTEELKRRALAGWEYTRSKHSREAFSEAFSNLIDMLDGRKKTI
jgi:glycosyltransferase involved in cell wall biosynthesis